MSQSREACLEASRASQGLANTMGFQKNVREAIELVSSKTSLTESQTADELLRERVDALTAENGDLRSALELRDVHITKLSSLIETLE